MIGKYIYGEWLIPVVDYYRTLKQNEINFEIFLPLSISTIVTGVYHFYGHTLPALLKLRDILPASLAILIGFTITCITIIISSTNENIVDIKKRLTERIIAGRKISFYQWFLIMFIYALLVQVFLLLVVFFTAFILRIYSNCYFVTGLLFIEVYLTLHILLLLTRNITNFYFVFFRDKIPE